MDDSDIIVSLHLVHFYDTTCYMHAPMQHFQNALAYFAVVVNYKHKMFMKLIPGEKEDFGHSGSSSRTSDKKLLGKDYPLKDYPLKDYPLKDYPLKDHPLKGHPSVVDPIML
jgi:hypothetical protein